MITVIKKKDLKPDLIKRLANTAKHVAKLEVICLVRADEKADMRYFDDMAWEIDERVISFSLGWLATGRPQFFRTWHPVNKKWEEYRLARGFNPLEFRELRVIRLKNFESKILYRSSAVTLLESTAISNPREKRLFALASFYEPQPLVKGE